MVKSPPENVGDMGLSLVWEDPTCLEVTKPKHYNYLACVLQLLKSTSPRAHAL